MFRAKFFKKQGIAKSSEDWALLDHYAFLNVARNETCRRRIELRRRLQYFTVLIVGVVPTLMIYR